MIASSKTDSHIDSIGLNPWRTARQKRILLNITSMIGLRTNIYSTIQCLNYSICCKTVVIIVMLLNYLLFDVDSVTSNQLLNIV